MSAAAYGSPDGIHVRQYLATEAYTQDGPDGLMPAHLAASFIAMGVASTAGGSVSGGQQTINNTTLSTLLAAQYDPGFYSTPADA